MSGLLSIGDFSRMTFLTVKALRHYHDVGLLEGGGEVVAFVPVTGAGAVSGAVRPYEVPAARLAVTTYDGPMVDLDEAYDALGRRLLERAHGGDGPVRERYLPLGDPEDLLNHRTEICWPVRA